MIYKVLLTDEFLSHFRLDDNGKTLVLTDKTGLTRAVMLEEVKHGEWIKTSKNLSTCSSCGNCILSEYTEDCFFCPNCGADMRDEENE